MGCELMSPRLRPGERGFGKPMERGMGSFLKGKGLAEAAGESKGKERVGYGEKPLSHHLG